MRPGSLASDVYKILDSGRILQAKEPFFEGNFNGGFVFAIEFFGCFFCYLEPDFWSEFSRPTVGFLAIFSQFFFQKRDLK